MGSKLPSRKRWGSKRQEGGRGFTADRCSAGCGQVVQHVAPLLAERSHRRQDPFDELTPGRTLGAKTAPPPQYGAAQRAFRTIIGGLYLTLPHKRPQRGFPLQQITTRP